MMTQREQRVMDLYDEGLPISRIASRLGITRAAVITIRNKYTLGDGGFTAMIATGSEQLRKALYRAHPERMPEALP